ncbi:MAG: molecular chaperone TorD family protein [Coriobacteriales bacterium]|jgi:TorA maturation chaperone TorD|nr:molecular chaperone TorD family protein [Coriobacteriales bacterium]
MLIYEEPTAERLALLISEEFFSGIPFANSNQQIVEGLSLLSEWAKDASKQNISEVKDELNREWLRLLVGLGEPAAPPWAAYYFEKDPVIFGAKTLEVRKWYARHGLELKRKYTEPDDHLGLMLQFLSVLIGKETESLEAGETDNAQQLRLEQKEFLNRNLLPWVDHWQNLMSEEARTSFYKGLALLITGTLHVHAAGLR